MKAKPEVWRIEFLDERPAILMYNRKEMKDYVSRNLVDIDAVYQLEWRSIKF
jgi:hypothetical protein